MKKIISVFLGLLLWSFYGCSNDSSPTTSSTGGLSGTWQADQIQLVHAPNTGGQSAQMKLQLQQLGSMPASAVGWANLTFGSGVKWMSQTIGGTDPMDVIFFVDAQNGFIVPSRYNLTPNIGYYATSNGGSTWNHIIISNLNDLYALSFINGQTGWAVGATSNYYTALFQTTDGGMTWHQIFSFSSYNVSDIHFVNALTGFAAGNNTLLSTTDGGTSWINHNQTGNYFKIKFINDQTGWVGGENTSYSGGVIKRTTDGGSSWGDVPVNCYLTSFDFIDLNTGFISGYNNSNYDQPVFVKTLNGGSSWTTIGNFEIRSYGNSKGFYFLDANTGYTVNGSSVLKTVNGGTNWSQEYCEFTTGLNDIYMKDSQNGFITADNGRIWTRTGGTDPNTWSFAGKITNASILNIVDAHNDVYIAGGGYTVNGSDITFTVLGYTYGPGHYNNITVGGGSFTASDRLNMTLNFANDEQWTISFKK